MRAFLIFIFLSSFAFSSVSKSVILYYQFKNYEKACEEGLKIINKSNEAMLSLIGVACAKSDYIDTLAKIAPKLSSNKSFRENRSYFFTLLLQKSLILQFLKDDISIENLKFPKTEHILSLAFENIASKNYKLISKNPKILRIKTKESTFEITISKKEKNVILIKEYMGDIVTKTHRIR